MALGLPEGLGVLWVGPGSIQRGVSAKNIPALYSKTDEVYTTTALILSQLEPRSGVTNSGLTLHLPKLNKV